MSARGIGALERGDRRTPQRETLVLLADALRLTAADRSDFEAAAVAARSRRVGGASVAALPWPAAPVSNLPLSLTKFVGRETEIVEITALLREGRLVTLTGVGGIGKTRTALEVATALSDGFASGVWLVALAALSDPSHVPSAVASALGVQESPNRSTLEVLLAFLQQREVLVVLDNCEHVIAAVSELTTELLRRCPGLRVLATSREPLSVSGERVFRLDPLSVSAATALFEDRARAADRRFALTDETAEAVTEICRRLDGLPLAIELVAARSGMFSATELARRLGDRFHLLTTARTGEPRQRTIRALIDWSYDLLSAQEQRLFRTLAIFSGGFTFEHAAAVNARLRVDEVTTLDLLSSLVGKSLAQAEPVANGTRYRLLETVQHYARERLLESGEHEAVASAHAATFAAFGEAVESGDATMADDEWKSYVAPEMDNCRAVLVWSLAQRHDLALGQRLAAALRSAWQAFAPAEGRDWTRLAIDTIGQETPPGVVARLHLTVGQQLGWLRQASASYDALQMALTFFRQSPNAGGIAEAQRRAGNALVIMGRAADAATLSGAALEAYRNLDLPKMTTWALLAVAFAQSDLGDMETARKCGAEALAIAKERGFDHARSVVTGGLAEFEFRAGDAEAALRHAQDALALAQTAENDYARTHHLTNIAAYLVALGRYSDARTYAREALALSREVEVRFLTAASQQHLAAVAALAGARTKRPRLRAPYEPRACSGMWMAASMHWPPDAASRRRANTMSSSAS